MSGRAKLALCAYAATLMASGALLPLVIEVGWFVQAALLLAVLSGAGALVRRFTPARPPALAAQAVLAMVALTVVFAREQAVAGVLPGPEAVQRLAALLQAGAEDVGQYAIPAPATDGIRLMLIGGVLLIGLAVDALAVTFRSAAPAGLPLLALYSVAAGLSDGGSTWPWFLLAATGYLVLLLAEGRDRISQWGRVFGGAPAKPAGRAGSGFPASAGGTAPVRTGRRIGVVALGIALVVPAALPSLSGGLLADAGTGGSGGGGGTISAVNPLVSLQNDLNQPEDREVLRYRTNAPDPSDMYLRMVALDRFDGTSWKSSERKVGDVPEQLPRPQGLGYDVESSSVTTNISAADSYEQKWLPLPYPATVVGIEGRWRYEPEGRMLVGDDGQTTRGTQYSVTSLVLKPTPSQLANAPAPPESVAREYTSVPDSLPEDVRTTALEVTEGAENDYERAVKLQDWFAVEGGFTYDTEVESGTGVDAVSRFLRDKEGFCVHFSFSMAAMARTLGIPARVAVGFTPGAQQGGGVMSVGIRDAHAWPELYFDGVGWLRFEPTPTRGTAPEYTRPQTPSGATPTPVQPEASASAAPSPTPSTDPSCTPQMQRLDECGGAAATGELPPADPGTPVGTVLLVALGVVAVVLIPLLPMLWRIRVRARRLSSGGRAGRAAEDAGARTLAAWREVVDTAWDHGVVPDESRTPRSTAERIVRLGRLEGGPAEAVHRMASAVEQVLYAPWPRPATGLAEDAARVRTGLRAALGPVARLRATLVPRSAVRVLWAVSERWAAVADRWSAGRRRVADRWSGLLRRPSRQRG
ncbi:transglutaminaseTgpA domain-containing protein [Streptomyces sp. NPDC003036]|uniref:transglutaminaseTgpA domain-containing protein n=1 Tax=Streptomyces sp. NPDC003036 TaxID=3154442 RepID=UPI0033BB2A79